MRREGSALAPARILIIGAAVLAVLLIVGAAVAQGVPQQGRYLLPAAGPIACCLAIGWAEWLPQRNKRLLPLAVGGGLLLLNAVAWLFYMRPAFYGR
jgi:type II secretory pathway component PulM